MYLVDFMNEHPRNWQELLAAEPYYLHIKQEGSYYLLSYDMYTSDFNEPMVLEARGSIFTEKDNTWVCVCRALDKFFNYGESFATTSLIDWGQGVSIQEKIDGSICKVWYDNGWHVSSNKGIDAHQVSVGDEVNFYSLFLEAIHNWPEAFFKELYPSHCYWFELVSPKNRIVVEYKETKLYYLGSRNMVTMEEDKIPIHYPYLAEPRTFHYNSLAECIAAAHHMGDDEEGYVVVSNQVRNDSHLRVKVKGDEYLRLHFLAGNHVLTWRTVLTMWREDTLDDYCAYFPESREKVENYMHYIKNLIACCDSEYEKFSGIEEDKKFASAIAALPNLVKGCLFSIRRNKAKDAYDFFKNIAFLSSIIKELRDE